MAWLSKKHLCFIGTLSVVAIITTVDLAQRRPQGAPLGAPTAVAQLPETQPFDLSSATLVAAGGSYFLTGELIDQRKEESAHEWPGTALDAMVPARAEEERRRRFSRAAASAISMHAMGQTDLGASILTSEMMRQAPRQYIARLAPAGQIDVRATLIEDMRPRFTVATDRPDVFLASGLPSPTQTHSALSPSFISEDGGTTWRFDPKTLMPSWIHPHGFVNKSDGFLLADPSERDAFLITRDRGQSWQSFDLAKAVWGTATGTREFEEGIREWALFPAGPNRAVGWSGWYAPPSESTADSYARPLKRLVRFELAFEAGRPVMVRNVQPETNPEAADIFGIAIHEYIHLPGGGVLVSVRKPGRYVLHFLDPSTWQWRTSISVPKVGAGQNYMRGLWAGQDVWIADLEGWTPWNYLPCLLSSHLRLCADFTVQNFFFSTDQGRHWTPFRLGGADRHDDQLPALQILGWDAQARRLMAWRHPWRDETGDKDVYMKGSVEWYALPSPAARPTGREPAGRRIVFPANPPQWRKWRTPVKTITTPRSSAASITS